MAKSKRKKIDPSVACLKGKLEGIEASHEDEEAAHLETIDQLVRVTAENTRLRNWQANVQPLVTAAREYVQAREVGISSGIVMRSKALNDKAVEVTASLRDRPSLTSGDEASSVNVAPAVLNGYRKAVVQLVILRDRAEGCDALTDKQRREQKGHALTLMEVPSWIAEHRAILAPWTDKPYKPSPPNFETRGAKGPAR